MQVEVYAGTEKVRLYLNDKLIGEMPTTAEQQRKAIFTVPYAPGTLKAVGVNGDREVATNVLQTVGIPTKLRLTADRSVLHCRRTGSVIHHCGSAGCTRTTTAQCNSRDSVHPQRSRHDHCRRQRRRTEQGVVSGRPPSTLQRTRNRCCKNVQNRRDNPAYKQRTRDDWRRNNNSHATWKAGGRAEIALLVDPVFIDSHWPRLSSRPIPGLSCGYGHLSRIPGRFAEWDARPGLSPPPCSWGWGLPRPHAWRGIKL